MFVINQTERDRMKRGTCRGCSHPVVYANYEDSLLVLEAHETAGGAGRYAIWDDGSVHPVPSAAEVLAYPLHICKALERLRRDGGMAEDHVAQ